MPERVTCQSTIPSVHSDADAPSGADEASGTTGGAAARDQSRATEPPPTRTDALASWLAARLILRTAPCWLQGAVVLVMLCLLVAIEAIAAYARPTTFHPAPLLLAGVVFATLVGGLVAGLVTVFLAVAYELSFALTHGEDLRYALGSVVVLLIVAPATALAIGTLRTYAERAGRDRERLLDQQAESRARVLALQDTNRRMDVFVGMVTHELKTPLTSLKGSIQLVMRQQIRRVQPLQPQDAASDVVPGHAAEEQTMLDLLRRADHQVDRLTRLVDDLLDVSRAQTDKLVLRPEPCDLVELVQEVVADERTSWPARSIAVEAPSHSIYVNVDRGRIAQVVTNYLTNALKYAPIDTPIDVRVWADEAGARVAVHDIGPGLTEDEQMRVWERFHQVAGSQSLPLQTMTSGGLGLGLFISRAIIQRHGGEVGVESAPGNGTTFWFAVPRQAQQHA